MARGGMLGKLAVALADIVTNAPGTVTGFERKRIQDLVTGGVNLFVNSVNALSGVFYGQGANLVRVTPSVDVDGNIVVYGTNAANSAVKWAIYQNGRLLGTADAITAGTLDRAYLDASVATGKYAGAALGANVTLTALAWNNILGIVIPPGVTNRAVEVSFAALLGTISLPGQIYYRIISTTGLVAASGYMERDAATSDSVFLRAIYAGMSSGQGFTLQAYPGVAARAYFQNGLGDNYATRADLTVLRDA